MSLEDNLRNVANDLGSFVNGIRKTFTLPLVERRINSKAGLRYLSDELEDSTKKLAQIDLGGHLQKIKGLYDVIGALIGEYLQIEDRDIAHALGPELKLPDTADPTELSMFLVRQQYEESSQFSKVVSALDTMLDHLRVGFEAYSPVQPSSVFGPSRLRDKVANLISELDKYKIEAQGTMRHFIIGTEQTINLSSSKYNPFL